MSQSEKKICPWPWVGWSTQTDGRVRICPYSQASSSTGVCTDASGAPQRADTSSVVDARNNPIHKKLRLDMLNGNLSPQICGRCYEEENAGLVSRRQIEVKRSLISMDEMTTHTDASGAVNTEKIPLKIFDVRLGNNCNLTCRMCSPGSSNKWYKEWYKTTGQTSFDLGDTLYNLTPDKSGNVTIGSDNFEWYERSDLWEHLTLNTSQPTELHFSGGEPLLIKEHYKFLHEMSKKSYANNITISYNTNLTYLPKEIINYWKYFKKVEVAVSLDAYGEVNNYIRHPSNFNEIAKNLRALDETGPNVTFWINSTIQMMNSFAFFDLLEWIFTSGHSKMNHWNGDKHPHNMFISHTRVTYPESFSIEVMPETVKQKWYARSEQFLEWLQLYLDKKRGSDSGYAFLHKQVSTVIHGYEKIIRQKDKSYLAEDFLKRIERSDVARNQSFAKIFPELHRDLTDHVKSKMVREQMSGLI